MDHELDEQIDIIFKSEDEPPIQFIPRKSNSIDMAIAGVIEEYDLTVPIAHIKDKTYQVGSVKMPIDIKNGDLMVTHEGITEKFEDYVPSIEKTLERMLVFEMIKTEQSLEDVFDNLVAGKERTFRKHTINQWRDLHGTTLRDIVKAGGTRSPRMSVRVPSGYGMMPNYDLSGRKSASRAKSPSGLYKRTLGGNVTPEHRGRKTISGLPGNNFANQAARA